MARIFCKYHPDTPARWVCRQCQINFCRDCIDTQGDTLSPCPVCGEALESLGSGNVIRPFWQRIPQFFLFPGHFTPLIFMLLIVVVNILLGESLFGFLVGLLLFIIFMKYAYVVLEHTAQGYLKPQRISSEMLTQELELPFKQLFIIFLLFIFNGVLFNIGLLLLGQFITALILPASIMVLAVEHSFFRAVNPVTLLGVIKRIGAPYFIMCLFLFFLLSGEDLLTKLMIIYLPETIYQPLAYFISMYFILIMFHMMGYVLYQYHEQLGYNISREYTEKAAPQSTTESEPGLREVQILLREGKVEEAKQRLISLVQAQPGNMACREKLHKLLLTTADVAGLRAYSGDYIVRLMLEKRPSEALRVYSDCYQLDKAFKFGSGQQRHEMAKLLYKNGQARAALSLLSNMHRDYPGYEGIPDAYLLVAKILCESFNEDGKARQVLDFVQAKYPHHPRLPEVMEYKKIVESLVAR